MTPGLITNIALIRALPIPEEPPVTTTSATRFKYSCGDLDPKENFELFDLVPFINLTTGSIVSVQLQPNNQGREI